MENYYVYILSNKNRTVLYIGFTKNLKKKLIQHEKGYGAIFTKAYNATELIYFEPFKEIKETKLRERQLKNWHKEWKWNLIKMINPKLETLKIN